MKTGILRFESALLVAAVGATSVLACSSDDNTTPAPAGTGSGGAAGAAGAAGGGNGGSAGGSGTAGGGGRGGAADAGAPQDGGARDVAVDCGVAGTIHTAPTVPPPIAAPAGVVLVAGYRAVGDQIYTCVPPTSDAGTGAGDGGVTGSWVNTAVATLYGDNCSIAAQHSFTSGPTWGAADGSIVIGARVSAFAAPGADGGDGGGNAIPWLLLRAAVNTGEGTFGTVTYIHRTDTVGGLGPAGACDPRSDASATVRSPYSATYYFYTGGNAADAASDTGSSEAGGD
jgi:hypothetical protein